MRQPLIYGGAVFLAVWFVGWSTGMGGSFIANVVFALLMGIFATICYWMVTKLFRKPDE
ncbi:MAG: hypothetical protein OXQ30_07420 [Boseongicola sp.]|nr:hypothetical protein [Boseongicola sp.]